MARGRAGKADEAAPAHHFAGRCRCGAAASGALAAPGGAVKEAPMNDLQRFQCASRRQFLSGAAIATVGMLWSRKGSVVGAPLISTQAKLAAPLPDPSTKGFHVWNVQPIDYVAEEYLMSGTSPIWEPTSVLDTASLGSVPSSKAPFNYLQHTPNHEPRKVLGSGPYTTRLVIYRPQDMTKFNGVTIIEPVHPDEGGYIYVFNVISRFYASRGIAVATIQHPRNFKTTMEADPRRYGSLEVKDWTQFWATIGQLGALLKSEASPLRAATKR